MHRIFRKLILFYAVALLGVASLTAATVTTDREDYPPDSTAIITGSGFAAGETVELQVLRIDQESSGPQYEPWQVTADANGDFTTPWYVGVGEEGATLQVTASGLSSGLVAQHIFTDASIVAATGGSTISADTTGGAWTALTGPTLTETSIGDLTAGTVILNVPPGFIFDTSAPAPNVRLAVGDTSNGNKNINNLVVGNTSAATTTTTNITFTISSKSNGQVTNVLVFQNIRVRPTAGTPLASGNITNSGTATQGGGLPLTNNFGTLIEVPGAATKLAFTTSPVTVTAGVASGTITVQRQDQFNNPTTNGTTTVNLSSSSANGSFLNTGGTATITSTNILSGASTAGFLYKDTFAGSPTITNSATGLTSATQTETISKAAATISGVTASQTNTYGTASITLNGTVSGAGSVYPTNGELVSITINSVTTNAVVAGGVGGFSINFSTATIPASASAYTITYAYAGGTNLNAAANNTSTSLKVNTAALSITANNDSKIYGQVKTYGAGQTTFSSSALQNSETIGSVTITASGGTAGNAAVGTYNLTPSAATGGTFNAANYSITYNNGTLTVNKASTTGALATTAASALPGVNVTFTNTLSVVAPGAGTPTGNVQFKTNGVAFGSPVSLSGLAAVSATIATLPHGSNVITAEYAGDGNFIGATNSLTPAQVINTPPVARSVTTSVPQNGVVAINFNLGKYQLATDADADALKIISVSGATNAALGIISSGLAMTYTNTSGTAGTFDAFSFVVSDGFGGLATNTATVRIESPTGFNQLSVSGNTLKYLGVPGANYALENTAILSPATWVSVVTNTVSADGSLTFNLGATPSGFYRTRYVSGP